MARRLNFHWNLRRLMAAHEMWKTTDLIPLLRRARHQAVQPPRSTGWSPRSPSVVHAHVLVALCDIFDCTPADLIEPYVEAARQRKAAGEAGRGAPRPGPTPGTRPHPGRPGRALISRHGATA